jgi:hypothetical protein
MMIDRRLHLSLGSQDHVIRLHFSQFIAVASMSKASDIFDCPVTPSQSAEYKESFQYKKRTVEQKTSNLRYKLISTLNRVNKERRGPTSHSILHATNSPPYCPTKHE